MRHRAVKKPPFLLGLANRFTALEERLSRKANMITFLVIRFLLMSAMIVGFRWFALDLHP